MVAGIPPIRAKKTRYFTDKRFMERVLAPPATIDLPPPRRDEWSGRVAIEPAAPIVIPAGANLDGGASTGPERRKVPELTPPPKPKAPDTLPLDFGPASTELEDRVKRLQGLQRAQQQTARQASLDPSDGIEL